jgi:tRNA pseudouridine55 synthase
VSSQGPDGVLLIDKPAGVTSHDAVAAVRRALGTRKVGHAGTLDPMATGLLVMGVGRGTRLLRFVGDLPKTYEGAFVLGITTDTLDAEGAVTARHEVAVGDAEVRRAMAALVGDSLQRPPAYSAVKVGGTKLMDAARRGEELEAAPRPIRVDAFELASFAPATAQARFRAVVSGGTYVRVLVADVGDALGCGAHLSALRRTAIGHLEVADASPPEAPGALLPLERALAHLPRLQLQAEEAVAASHGRPLGPAGLDGPYAVAAPGGALVGVYRDEGPMARPMVILAPG